MTRGQRSFTQLVCLVKLPRFLPATEGKGCQGRAAAHRGPVDDEPGGRIELTIEDYEGEVERTEHDA